MIALQGLYKSYRGRGFENRVLSDVSLTIRPGDALGICGANGAGKSTLIRMIAGVERPDRGRVLRTMRCSWPIGYASAFQPSLSGADNARFVARIYGRDPEGLLDEVEAFAELGSYLYEPVRHYSAGMQARLAFAVSLAIDFDCYLVDEVTGAGDHRFRERSERALKDRRDRGTLVMVSHDPDTLLRFCTRGALVYGGNVTLFDTMAEAADVHHRLQKLAA